MHLRPGLTAALFLGFCSPASAGIIATTTDAGVFFADGAVSLTGPLPELGNVGTSVTLGDATLSAGDTLFVGSGWSTLLPDDRAIAISGPENLDISIDTGLATAFGFYFHEPNSSTAQLDGCNTACVDSLFEISFWLGGILLDTQRYNPNNDQLRFAGIYLDEVFDEVRFAETVGSNDNEFFGEMYVVQVPEPATLWLLGGSLIGVGLMRRRRTASAPPRQD